MYFWIIPLCIILLFSSYFSVQYSKEESYKWFIYITLINMIPIWPLAVMVSKNLLFDALLYDILLMVFSVIFISYFENSYNFSIIKIIGLMSILIGMILFKLG